MPGIWLDYRLAMRSLAKAPLLTLLALLSLTLGIGANTAIFSVFNALLLRPLRVPEAHQLISLSTGVPGEPATDQGFTWAMFLELRQNAKVFSDVFCWRGGTLTNFDVKGTRHRAALAQVSGNYFQALRIRPFAGRFITEGDTGLIARQSQPVAVLSYRVWRAWFHADPNVAGQKFYIEGKPFTVIGVQPEDFAGLATDGASDVTIPLFPPDLTQPPQDAKHLWYTLFARLRPSVSAVQAQARLQATWPRILEASAPSDYAGPRRSRFLSRTIRFQSAEKGLSMLRTRFSHPLQFLQLAAGIILLIACANLGNLFLAKAVARRREAAVQAAIGATRWDIARPYLIESLLLSAAGTLVGIVAAYPTARLIVRTAWTGVISTPLQPAIDFPVLAFAVAACILTAVLFGTVPAFYSAKTRSTDALRESQGTRHGANTTRRLLLVAQFALSVVLLYAAILFVGTLHSLRTEDCGYKRDHLLTFELFPQPAGTRDFTNLNPYYQALANAIRHLPGVTKASYSESGPANEFESFIQVYRPSALNTVEAVDETVAPEFFQTAGMRLLAGREFDWTDLQLKQPPAIIS